MNNSTTTIGHQEQYELQDGIIAEFKKYIKELAEFENVKNRCLAGEFSIKDFEKELYKNKYGNKKIKINVPDGYEIDKENSTFECIKFKPIKSKFSDYDGKYRVNGYYISDCSSSIMPYNIHMTDECYNCKSNKNIFATEKQAKSALAMAQISQIMANDERFGGVVKELDFGNTCAKRFWQIQRIKLKSEKPYIAINQVDASYNYSVLTFYKLEQAVLFLEENEDLVKDYLMID